MKKLTVDDAIIVLECSRPYASYGCSASDEEIDEAMLMGAEALERTQWIPVSERLPNLDDFTGSRVWQKKVLITGYMSFDSKKELFVTTAFAEEVINKRSYDTIIKARMPLPEPYKEE